MIRSLRAAFPALAAVLIAPATAVGEAPDIWRGVDLSYVNELEDCGATWADPAGKAGDPYRIFKEAGANIVRLRLWHTPEWTRYSTLDDVRKSITRAKAAGLSVLLDFHYSDDWAHPGKQLVPAAWADTDDPAVLAARLGDYTYATLMELGTAGLLPDAVQVGNETNTDLLITKEVAEDAPVDWDRNVQLLNAGLDAVARAERDAGADITVMLHIAQPENVERWFDGGVAAGLGPFDVIGLSYYPKWSSTSFSALPDAIRRFETKYGKDVVVVETAYPWTLDSVDKASNLLGEDSLVDSYPATPEGQARYLDDLMGAVRAGGGNGVVYWEPAWISTSCETRWGKGSHWENATLFDFGGRLLPGAAYLRPAK